MTAPKERSKLLQVSDLSVSFEMDEGEALALDGVNFEVVMVKPLVWWGSRVAERA